MKTHYFSPGPASLPAAVRQAIHEEFLDTFGFGVSIAEISHRSPQYSEINEKAHILARDVFQVPTTHEVLFTPFGAQQHFCLLMDQLSDKGDTVAYFDSGNWAHLAVEEAKRSGRKVVVAHDGAKEKYISLGNKGTWNIPKSAKYLHVTVNNTVFGTEYPEIPNDLDTPLVLDMTSSIGARQDIPWEKTAVVYASAQKNFGIAGISVVIVKKETLQQMESYAEKNGVGLALSYASIFKAKSALNTPPTFPVYCAGKMLEWMKAQGGTPAMEKIALEKAKTIYTKLDEGFYTVLPTQECRSRHNFVFKCPTPELDKLFVEDALKVGIREVKGYRSVGGIRCSVYNGISLESAKAFADFVGDFRNKRG